MARQNWTEQQIAEALAIAGATSIREASRKTGMPKTTLIRHWRAVHGTDHPIGGPRTGPDRAGEKLMTMADEVRQRAVDEAVDKVTEALTDRLTRLADRLYGVAEKSVVKVEAAIANEDEQVLGLDGADLPAKKKGESHDRDGAAWVRSLVGVMAQAIDKAQLLSGKPTARPEGVNRHEYHITQRIISDPESVDLAEQLLRRAAGRDPSTFSLDG